MLGFTALLFANHRAGQQVAKYRCGHGICIACHDRMIHRGWSRCAFCRRSARTRTVPFVPEESAAAAAAAEDAAEGDEDAEEEG